MKLFLYIQYELIVDFAFAVGGMLVLSLPGAAVSAVNRLAGVDASVLLSFLPYLLANLLPYLLPLGFLLALVVCYGRLAADNEWTAMRMAGVHPLRLVLPALPLCIGLGVLSLWFCAEGQPEVRTLQEKTAISALRRTITNLSPGRTELHLGKFSLIAGYREGNDFLRAVIHVPAMNGHPAQTLRAQRVRMGFSGEVMLVQLQQAHIVHGELDVTNANPTFRLDLKELQQHSDKNYRSLRYRRSSDIWEELSTAKLDPQKADVMRFEVHQRNAVASIYFVYLMLGLPLGLLLGRGKQLGALALAVGVALLYYVLAMRLGQELATNNLMPPILCAWTVNALGMGAGAWLMRKAFRQ
ncbi:MAG: LptF/LptG family permease [Planctomycetes bacterium]|nr:LptF/LptG family permease [Planctomycetota bacterium]